MADAPNNQTSPNAAQGQSETDIALVVRPPAAAIPQPPPPPPENHYPRKRRRWTKDPAMFWVTLAGVIVVVAYTSVAAWQACLSRKQLIVMQEDQRPWIGSPKKITVEQKGSAVGFRSVFVNVGRMATYGLDIQAQLKFGDWQLFVKPLCDERENWVRSHLDFFHQFSAVPGSNYPSRVPENITLEMVQSAASPIIIGCVIYGWRGDNALHKTGYVAGIDLSGGTVSVPDAAAIDAD